MSRNFIIEGIVASIDSNTRLEETVMAISFLQNECKLSQEDKDFVNMFTVDGKTVPYMTWAFDFRATDFNRENDVVTVEFNIGGPGGGLDGEYVYLNAGMLNEQSLFRLEKLREQYGIE